MTFAGASLACARACGAGAGVGDAAVTFGPAASAASAINIHALSRAYRARRIADPNWADNPRAPAEYALLAVSATDLQGVRPGDDPLRFFRSVRPVARAGYSIFLFDLDTPEKRAVFREASHHPGGWTSSRVR